MARPIARRASTRRIQLLVVLVLGLFTLLLLRAAYLGTVRSSWLSAKADSQHLIRVNEPAERGAMMSTDGLFLAMDTPTVQIIADGRYVKNALRTTDRLVAVLGGSPKRREKLLSDLSARKAYVVVAPNASLRDARVLKRMKIDGVVYRRNSKRTYPLGAVAGQVLGFTNLETRAGVEGLEARLNTRLTGRDGGFTEVQDMRLGQTVRILNERKSVAGQSVELTIHADIQKQVEEVLAATRTKYKAKSAMAIIMDPNNGRIVAMASVPRMNANNRATLDVTASQVRAITDPYEPGSVFKVVTVAGALEEGLTTPSTMYTVPAKFPFEFEGRTRYITDAHKRESAEDMTTTDILQRSSNVGTILISQRLQKRDKLRYWMDRFGFGQKTGIDLNNESDGDLPKTPWDDGRRYNIPFGQGLTATMLQQTRAYAAIANGGLLVTPHVVAAIDGRASAVPSPKRIISTRTAAQLTGIMRTVVEASTGTGGLAQIANYQVAGKTGTSQKVINKRYSDKHFQASFIGFVPAKNPKLVIAVMIDDPSPNGGPHTAAEVAAPAFQTIGDYALGRLGIAP
ncbi:MAG TPA: penicillin-binding protein 2 [Miltoncostaeales bacterium]|nr:penicillin-binding protein 2 [Miltoncostaeales bacterium]